MKCLVPFCQQTLKSSQALSKHVLFDHDMTSQQYWDSFCEPTTGCQSCGMPTRFLGILKGYSKTCGHSCAQHLNRKRLKNNTAKELSFRQKLSIAKKAYHHSLTEEQRLKRSQNISRAVKNSRQHLSKAERRQKFAWVDKLSDEQREAAIEKMLTTGCHRWWKTCSEDERVRVIERRTRSVMTYVPETKKDASNIELSVKTIDALNRRFDIE